MGGHRGARLGVVAALVAGGLGLAAHTADAKPVPKDERDSKSEHDRIVEFWTNERVAQAKPREFVYDPATKGFHPAAKPGGGGGGGGGGGAPTVLGASWNGGGAVANTTGKVLFAMGGSYWVCSASVVQDDTSGRSIILTAGHCAVDETNGEFATNWMFVPNYDAAPAPLDTGGLFCNSTKYGCWTAQELVVSNAFATAGSFNATATMHDYAFAVVGAGGKTGVSPDLDSVVQGGQVLSTINPAVNTSLSLFGYPAAGRYRGNDLVYCQGPVGSDALNGNLTYQVACNMTGGSSGGPWFSGFNSNTGRGTLVSVNSYGYSGITAMYGPKFNDETANMLAAATTASTNTYYGRP
jgi:V8-like Glu-specific endopeptidase